jgi:hypothetical protein
MVRRLSILLLGALPACNASDPPASVVMGAQCSSTALYSAGEAVKTGSARSEGNGIVSLLRSSAVPETGGTASVQVFGDCATGKGVSVGMWGNGSSDAAVGQFISAARRDGVTNDLDQLFAYAKKAKGSGIDAFRIGVSDDEAVNCACQLAQSGKL